MSRRRIVIEIFEREDGLTQTEATGGEEGVTTLDVIRAINALTHGLLDARGEPVEVALTGEEAIEEIEKGWIPESIGGDEDARVN